jgi:hypothetical protein
MKRRFALAAAMAVALSPCAATPARAQFTPGNLVVERVGDGSAGLTSNATPTFLDQYLPSTLNQAIPVNTVALPTTVIGQNPAPGTALAVTDSGSATSNGQFTRSADGTLLLVPGYNASVGTTGVAGSAPGTINRSIGVVNTAGTVTSTTGFSNGPSNNYRSVATVDGTSFWASTAGTGTTPGILYVPPAGVGSVTAATTIANGNFRNVVIAGNSLFASSASATPGIGIHLIGTAGTLPTSATTPTLLPGTSVTGTSPYGFQLIDNPLNTNNWNGTGFDTLYVADDTSNTGGLSRWEYNGTTWLKTGNTLTFGTATAAGARGLTLVQNGTNVTLFATTGETSQNRLVQISDDLTNTTPFAGGFTNLATAGPSTAFRGVALAPAPVPEPATVLGIAAAAGLAGLVRRRVRR